MGTGTGGAPFADDGQDDRCGDGGGSAGDSRMASGTGLAGSCSWNSHEPMTSRYPVLMIREIGMTGVVVLVAHGYPGEGLAVPLCPLRQQRRLAITGGRYH